MLLHTEKYSQKRFNLLFFIMLYATNFCGFAPIADLYPKGNMTYELPLLALMIYCGTKIKEKSEYKKWIFLLLITLIFNYLSTMFFEERGFVDAMRSSSFVNYLFLFFPIVIIHPTIKEVEKVIKYLGLLCLALYFIQQILLPTPIVESLTSGWRKIYDAGIFDIKRFTVTGEIIMFLFQLMAINKYFLTKNKKELLYVILVFTMCILHGYRSIILSMLISLAYIYHKIKGIKFNTQTISFIILFVISYYIISLIPFVQDILGTIAEKNELQFSGSSNSWLEIDRIIELDFFINQQLHSPLEWVFGCGFLSKEEYQNAGLIASFINWVDLGFIGLSFMGGILMTFCWLKLLILNMRKTHIRYAYLAAFSIFVITSTLSLPIAFNDRAPAIQALAFYIGFLIYKKK